MMLLSSVAVRAVEHPISSPPLGPTPRFVSFLTTVPLGDGFLAVWREGGIDDAQVRGIRLDGNGRPREGQSFVVAPTQPGIRALTVASDGSSAFVLSLGLAGASYVYRLDRVNTDGTVTNLSKALPLPTFVIMGMAASSGKLLVCTAQPLSTQPLRVTLFDHDGTLLRGNLPVADSGGNVSSIDLVAVNDTFLLAWIDLDSRVRVARVLLSDIVANTVPPLPFVRAASGAAYNARLAADTTRGLVAWWERSSSGSELRVRPLSNSGAGLGDGPISVGTFQALSPPAVTLRSDGYQVAFLENALDGGVQVTTLRISFDGIMQSAVHTPAGFATYSGYSVSAVSNGGTSVATWIETRYSLSGTLPGAEVVAAPLQSDGSLGVTTLLSTALPIQHVRKLLPLARVVDGIWTEAAPNARLVLGRFTLDGQPLDGAGLRLRESIYDQNNATAATNGDQVYVVWTEGSANAVQTLYGAVVPTSGFLSASVRVLATDAGAYCEVAVAWNGSSFTVVYQRRSTLELAALRVDATGNVIDPAPIRLTISRGTPDVGPRLSWNGSEYLLVWQRQSYFGIPIPILTPIVTVNQLFAQKFDAALSPSGGEIVLATTNLNGADPQSANSPSLELSGGVWLASWLSQPFDSVGTQALFARISPAGDRLDALNRGIGTETAPLLAAGPGGWTLVSGNGSLEVARITPDGTLQPTAIVLQNIAYPEAFALAPLPLVAYKRNTTDALTYIDSISSHRRAAGR